MLITPVILDAIETVRDQATGAVQMAKLSDRLAITLRQNLNKAIDETVEDAIRADAIVLVTTPPPNNGDYPAI